MDQSHDHSDTSQWKTRTNWVLVGFLAIGGFFLFSEHRAHLLGVLPFLFVLSCPLMHFFMHHGHGHHDHESGGQGEVGPTGRADELGRDTQGTQTHSRWPCFRFWSSCTCAWRTPRNGGRCRNSARRTDGIWNIRRRSFHVWASNISTVLTLDRGGVAP
jgi:Protein of unknown function (DUF2933)